MNIIDSEFRINLPGLGETPWGSTPSVLANSTTERGVTVKKVNGQLPGCEDFPGVRLMLSEEDPNFVTFIGLPEALEACSCALLAQAKSVESEQSGQQ